MRQPRYTIPNHKPEIESDMVKVALPTLDEMIARACESYGPEAQDKISRAYARAEAAHASQKRVSGEPYLTHCLAVAGILSDLNLDPATIAAGLLHDVVEDSLITVHDLEVEFGQEVAMLVDGVTKLAPYRWNLGPDARPGRPGIRVAAQDVSRDGR